MGVESTPKCRRCLSRNYIEILKTAGSKNSADTVRRNGEVLSWKDFLWCRNIVLESSTMMSNSFFQEDQHQNLGVLNFVKKNYLAYI